MIMKTIIFDIDGTIFDTKNGIIKCLNDVLSRYGEPNISDCDKYIGPPIKDSLMKYNGFSEEKAIEATSLYRELYVSKYIVDSVPYPGLYDILSYYRHKKYKLCIATMKTQNQVEALLKIFDVAEMFDIIETAKYDGGYSKTDMLESIKRECSCDKLYFVGDTSGDFSASKNAKIPFVYAIYGYGDINEKDCSVTASLANLKTIVQ